MARPLRRLWSDRPKPRRRHRTWMFAMTMATLGWAVVWIDLALARLAPSLAPELAVAAWVACGFGAVGLGGVAWAVRAKLAWLVVLSVPACANASLIAAPWALAALRHGGSTASGG
ncbi:MAG: hypothetical protein JNK02_15895 [Planctomycetes bacterium]|nr:hypothetical protein [Planctomycetota bacterium]